MVEASSHLRRVTSGYSSLLHNSANRRATHAHYPTGNDCLGECVRTPAIRLLTYFWLRPVFGQFIGFPVAVYLAHPIEDQTDKGPIHSISSYFPLSPDTLSTDGVTLHFIHLYCNSNHLHLQSTATVAVFARRFALPSPATDLLTSDLYPFSPPPPPQPS